jgi:cell division protein FtsZ
MADTPASSSDKPVLLIGVGRGGSRIADIVRSTCAFPGLSVVAADTDLASLGEVHVDRALQLGEAWARGEGCGGDTELADRAASASLESFRALLQDARMVFVTAGLGGGIGSVAPRLLARLARECGVPLVLVVTTPFSFEGAKRAQLAKQALELLRAESAAVIAVPNSLLFARLPPDTGTPRAFEISSTQLAQAVAGLARICSAKGLLVADLAGVKRIVRRPGCVCSVAMGHGQGPTACADALAAFLASPFIGDASQWHGTDAALLTLLCGDDLPFAAVTECLEKVQTHLPSQTEVLVGAYTDPRLQGQVQLTGLLVRSGTAKAEHQPDLPTNPKPGVATGRRRPRRTTPAEGTPTQAALPFPEQQLGVFAASPQPTFHNGENLDIPTFQRRNIAVDAGESIVLIQAVPQAGPPRRQAEGDHVHTVS